MTIIASALPHPPAGQCETRAEFVYARTFNSLHCWSHGVDEVTMPAFIICFECNHVYRTAEELQLLYATNAPFHLPREQKFLSVEQIHFCPLCMHDFFGPPLSSG
jgi:hypothetical protein